MKRNKARWFVWTALALMLLAMLGYVLSMDESDPDLLPQMVESPQQ